MEKFLLAVVIALVIIAIVLAGGWIFMMLANIIMAHFHLETFDYVSSVATVLILGFFIGGSAGSRSSR